MSVPSIPELDMASDELKIVQISLLQKPKHQFGLEFSTNYGMIPSCMTFLCSLLLLISRMTTEIMCEWVQASVLNCAGDKP